MAAFLDRVQHLPYLGLGVSTEHGAGEIPGALNVGSLHDRHPELAAFLEIGVETEKGLDRHAVAWISRGLPTTYHFLDLNLDEPEDLDAAWVVEVRSIADRMRAAWLCGDAGLWHFGPRERGNMLLLPPVLSGASADAIADGIVALREAVGREVLPENPPGSFYLGDLHILDFYARIAERADTGLLLDAAHLAMYQRQRDLTPTSGLDGFPCDRVVEMHVAGGAARHHDGYPFVEDDHGTDVLEDTWAILEHVVPRARNLRAVVFECERQPLAPCLPHFRRIEGILARPRPG